ncbi:uncharacterized protein SOCEGT47_031710 [Sorangium cellulosum]|uniref:Uncharacterized protein n=1 Tax=Sorangium cellulosum TaxID=56 RepID=A0A4P2Q0D4_SORCE|nr:hypothetical protein [Sorangium cellulosum]AUX22667.1 uncharacterized protein SOCEGT47_031710 [Sorangium cellulosum]
MDVVVNVVVVVDDPIVDVSAKYTIPLSPVFGRLVSRRLCVESLLALLREVAPDQQKNRHGAKDAKKRGEERGREEREGLSLHFPLVLP